MKECCPENFRGHEYVLVVIDNFSKFDWTVPLKNKSAETTLLTALKTSKRKPELIEKGYVNKLFTGFQTKTKIMVIVVTPP